MWTALVPNCERRELSLVYGYHNQSSKILLTRLTELLFFINRNPSLPILGTQLQQKATALIGKIASLPNAEKEIGIVEELSRDPKIVGILSDYFGVAPVFSDAQIWLTYPYGIVPDSEKHLFGFHYDIFDYKFAVVSFYRNDVSERTGPHVFIRESHTDFSFFKKSVAEFQKRMQSLATEIKLK